MKTKNLLFTFLAFAFIIQFGCKKEEVIVEKGIDATNLQAGKCAITFSASDAETLNFSSTLELSSAKQFGGENTLVGCLMTDIKMMQTMLVFDATMPVGTYNTNTTDYNIKFTFSSNFDDYITTSTKALIINITKVTSNTIEGTFSGSLDNFDSEKTLTISNGKFGAKFL